MLLLRAPALRRNSLQHENIMAGKRSGLCTEAAVGVRNGREHEVGKLQRNGEKYKKKACGHGNAERQPLTAHYPLRALIIAETLRTAGRESPGCRSTGRARGWGEEGGPGSLSDGCEAATAMHCGQWLGCRSARLSPCTIPRQLLGRGAITPARLL